MEAPVLTMPRPNQMLMAVAIALALPMPANAGMFGSPKFTMAQSDDRFSADGRTTYSSSGNRVSKRSIAGGTHIDKHGVFLDPMAVKDRSTGELRLLALSLVNETERMSSLGEPNAIGRPRRISIITGAGDPIVLEFGSADRKYGEISCNTLANGCSTPLLETGLAVLTIEQYRRLLTATALAIKLDGEDRSHVYETKDISPTFVANLKTFHDAYLANAR